MSFFSIWYLAAIAGGVLAGVAVADQWGYGTIEEKVIYSTVYTLGLGALVRHIVLGARRVS